MEKLAILCFILGVSVNAQEQTNYGYPINGGSPQNYVQPQNNEYSGYAPQGTYPGYASQGQAAPNTSPVRPDYHSNCGTCPQGNYRENAPFSRFCGRCVQGQQGSNNWNNCNNCNTYLCPYPCATTRRPPTYAPPTAYPTYAPPIYPTYAPPIYPTYAPPIYPTYAPPPIYPTHSPFCPPQRQCPPLICPPCPPQQPCPSQYPCPAVQCPITQPPCPRGGCPPRPNPNQCQYGNCYSNDDPNAGVNNTLIDSIPKITIEPKEVVARKGENVVLKCIVEEEGELGEKVYWKKEGVNDLNKKVGEDDGHSLILQSVTQEDAGTYVCFAYNNQGKEEKAEATIIVKL